MALLLLFTGCESPSPQKRITELYTPVYTPAYSYAPKQTQVSPSGYNIGIINMNVTTEAVPPNSYAIVTALEKQYLQKFIFAFSGGLEKILMSKGVTVSGPFKSYEEMTYPERSRCSYLVQPTLKIVFRPTHSGIQPLPGYRGPGDQEFIYGIQKETLVASAEMEFVILDPLTKEKLERHALQTEPISKQSDVLFVQIETQDQEGKVTSRGWRGLWGDRDHPNYHNGEVVIGMVTDDLFPTFMTKVDALLSIEELAHLQKYKDELKEKKRY